MDRQPNIVLIVTDQQRYDSLGCTGNPHARTPHLDALAGDSVNFHRHFTAASVCMPSRAATMTGRLPSANGVWNNGIALPRAELTPPAPEPFHRELGPDRDPADPPSHLPTMADLLADAGYETISIGKLHLTPTQCHASFGYPESNAIWEAERERMLAWHGPYMGFEHVELTRHHGEEICGHYGAWLAEHHPEADAARKRYRPGRFGVDDLKPGVLTSDIHPTTWCAERAAAHITERAGRDQPYLLWVGIPDPHHPWTPPADLAAEFENADYLPAHADPADCQGKPKLLADLMTDSAYQVSPEAIALIRRYTDAQNHLIDRAVGRIVAALQAAGDLDNTLLVFTSDHGDWLGAFGLVRKNNIASAHLNRTPLLVRFPGDRETAGIDCQTPVSNVDLLPTFCAAAGIEPPEVCHGSNLHATATGTVERDCPVLIQSYGARQLQASLSILEGQLRYAWWPGTGERELYNHRDDPAECRNVAQRGQYAEDVARLHQRLLEAHCAADVRVTGRISKW